MILAGKLLHKAIVGAILTMVVGTFVFGREACSYLKTWGNSVRNAVKSEVPIEFEVQRARELVENLVPDIRHCMHVIAEQQVEIDHLSEQLADRAADIQEQKGAILTLRTDLDSDKETFTYARRTYTADQVHRDLSRRFERFKLAKDSLDREEQILQARENALVANQEKLENMLVAKQDLEVQIAQLEARLKAVEAAETATNLDLDHSQLARAKKLITSLNKQLDIKEQLLDKQGQFSGLIPIEHAELEMDEEHITARIDDYFGMNKSFGMDKSESAGKLAHVKTDAED